MKIPTRIARICMVAGLGFFAAASAALAQTGGGTGREVVVVDLSGTIEYQKGGKGDWVQAAKDDVLEQSDIVRTGANSTCTLLFKGMSDAMVDLKPNSVMELASVSKADTGDNTELGLALGSVLIKAERLKDKSSFEVRTPNSIVGIRGTEFEVSVD